MDRMSMRTAAVGITAMVMAAGLIGSGEAREAGRPGAKAEHDWTHRCTVRANELDMRRKLRAPFIEQCIAGYRINHQRDLQSRKQKF